MNNRPERLLAGFQLLMAFLAAHQPPQRSVQRIPRRRLVRPTRDHVVERHRNIGAEGCLDFDCAFWCQLATSAVHVTLKLHAVVVDLAEAFERKDLKAPGVGEQRPFPRHELVEPAKLRDHLFTGPHVQVIGVGEHDLRTDGF